MKRQTLNTGNLSLAHCQNKEEKKIEGQGKSDKLLFLSSNLS